MTRTTAICLWALGLGACGATELPLECEGEGRACSAANNQDASPPTAGTNASGTAGSTVKPAGGGGTSASDKRDATMPMPAQDAGDAVGPEGTRDGATANDCFAPADIDPNSHGPELIVDAVTHAVETEVNPLGIIVPISGQPRYSAERMPWIDRGHCGDAMCPPNFMHFQDSVLGGPETDYALLTAIPYVLSDDPDAGESGFATFSNHDARELASNINTALGRRRALFTAAIAPNDRLDRQLLEMDRLAPDAVAWVLLTGWGGVNNIGFFLDDEAGRAVIERGIALDRPIFFVDKGMSGYAFGPQYTDPRDVGVVAKAYPQARFIVQHGAFGQGFEFGDDRSLWPEGPYDDNDPAVQERFPLTRGVNSLIKSLRDQGVGPNENVYVSLDEVWAHLITRPEEAQHVLGKLLKHIGEDNILWGTDSVLYGVPHPQVEAFRTFSISNELQDQYGYPALTEQRRAKVFGLNAARLFCLPK